MLVRCPDAERPPPDSAVIALGIQPADAIHVADAIGRSYDYLLSNDRKLRNRSDRLEPAWRLKVRRPSEFLVNAVRSGTPRTTRAPWPWESIHRILARD